MKVNIIRLLLVLNVFLFTFGTSSSQSTWRLVYENDEGGRQVAGKLSRLLNAVRHGNEVLLVWKHIHPVTKKVLVEHSTIAKFLTIMNDTTVFAQIDPIVGQTPDASKNEIRLKENIEWCLIVSSTGKHDSMNRNMVTGEITGHQQLSWGIKWYIRENRNAP